MLYKPEKPQKNPKPQSLVDRQFTPDEPTFEERKRLAYEMLPSGIRQLAEQAEDLTSLFRFNE